MLGSGLPRKRPSVRRVWFALLGLVALGGIAACATSPYSTMAPASTLAERIDQIYRLLIWLGAIVFVGVEAALIYALIRFRRRPGDGIPPQVHGSLPLEIGWTVVPALILVVIAVPTIRTIFETQQAPPAVAGEVLNVQVIGHQWWWEIRYPALGIVTANEIHVPVGRTVNFQLETADVIHSFWVPRLAGKRDLIPNKVNHLYLTPTEPGVFFAECAEFCGLQHAKMRLRVVVEPPESFAAWVQAWQQPTPSGPALPSDLARRGEQLFMTGACAGCHTIAGTPAQATVGPNLTRFGSRLTVGAGVLENTPEHLARWVRNAQEIKIGVAMPSFTNLSQDQIDALVAYLESLK